MSVSLGEYLLNLVSSGGVTVVLCYLIKTYVDIQIDKEQVKLNSKLDINLELIKNKLDKQNLKIQVAYSGFYEKQITVLIETYQKTNALLEKLNDIYYEGIYNVNYNEFCNLKSIFHAYVNENLIFIDDATYKKINDIFSQAWIADFGLINDSSRSNSIHTITSPSALSVSNKVKVKNAIEGLKELKRDLAAHTRNILNAEI